RRPSRSVVDRPPRRGGRFQTHGRPRSQGHPLRRRRHHGVLDREPHGPPAGGPPRARRRGLPHQDHVRPRGNRGPATCAGRSDLRRRPSPLTMPDAPSLITGETKAGDWRAYERVLLPPVKDLHKREVYEQHGGYEALKAVVKDGKFDAKGLADEVKASGLRGRGGAGFATGLRWSRSEEHTSELQSRGNLVCR